jgi:hypothetical protein
VEFNKLGATDLSISQTGLGCEWLNGLEKDLVTNIIHYAIDHGINFFDFLFNELTYTRNIGEAIKGYREKIIIQTHLGTGEREGKPKRDRDIKQNMKLFERTISLFETDYVDIINIQFVKEKEYEKIVGNNGLLELAIQLKEERRTRFIGASTHNLSVARRLVNLESIDTIMFPINIANHFMEGRNEFLKLCKEKNIGVIGIKPFLCGKLFEGNHTVYIAKYQTGGLTGRKKIPKNISASRCINYCLSQQGISSIIPGVKSISELDEILAYYKAKEAEKDFESILTQYHENK